MSAVNQISPTNTIGLYLKPLDPLFFRGGRPLEPGYHADSGLPTPQILAGALRTHLLTSADVEFDKLGRLLETHRTFSNALSYLKEAEWIGQLQIRGPWLAIETGQGPELFFNPPATLRKRKNKSEHKSSLIALKPLNLKTKLPGWNPEQKNMRPLWLPLIEPTEFPKGFITSHGLRSFLEKGIADPNEMKDSQDLFAFEERVGIGMDSQRNVTEEGKIYAASRLALKEDVSFYAEIVSPVPLTGIFDKQIILPWGGESRRVVLSKAKQLFKWPEVSTKANEKPCLVLTHHTILESGRWCPQCLEGKVIAAAVPAAMPISGWDLARGGPKPTRFAIPAGSVYFLDEPVISWPATMSDDVEDALSGWGTYMKGVWHD